MNGRGKSLFVRVWLARLTYLPTPWALSLLFRHDLSVSSTVVALVESFFQYDSLVSPVNAEGRECETQ